MILIADDNQEMRRMIRDLVADLEPEVIEGSRWKDFEDGKIVTVSLARAALRP